MKQFWIEKGFFACPDTEDMNNEFIFSKHEILNNKR